MDWINIIKADRSDLHWAHCHFSDWFIHWSLLGADTIKAPIIWNKLCAGSISHASHWQVLCCWTWSPMCNISWCIVTTVSLTFTEQTIRYGQIMLRRIIPPAQWLLVIESVFSQMASDENESLCFPVNCHQRGHRLSIHNQPSPNVWAIHGDLPIGPSCKIYRKPLMDWCPSSRSNDSDRWMNSAPDQSALTSIRADQAAIYPQGKETCLWMVAMSTCSKCFPLSLPAFNA